jgi:Ca2+-binding EF-hand superfamily protein
MKRLLLCILLSGVLALTAVPAAALQGMPTADEVFASLDTDKDGKLSEAEFAGLFEQDAPEDQKKEMFAKWDADGDRYVSKAEFIANYPKPDQQP